MAKPLSEDLRVRIIRTVEKGGLLPAHHPRWPFVLKEPHPGKAVQSDDELLDFARRAGASIFHPAGTCRMGHDAMAAVDPELRVRGLEGLRVVDAS